MKIKIFDEKIKSKKKIVVFYFPFKVVSGGPIYLTNLAQKLAQNPELSVKYIDYLDGYGRSLLEDSEVELLEYNDEYMFKLYPKNEVILITPIYWGNRVPIINPNSKILFFNWHNLCIPSLVTNLQCNDEIVKIFLEMVSRNKAEFYCDMAHWYKENDFGVIFEQIFVPITIPERKYSALTTVVSNNEINIAVIGRLVVDKIYAVLDLIHNIDKNSDIEKKIMIHIVGDGDCKKLLDEIECIKDIELIFYGTLSIDDIDELLSEKVDLLFAMGTSVLEGAAVGLPSVVIPNEIVPFSCNRYLYLHECKGYLLGWGQDQIDLFDFSTHSIQEILNDIYINNKKARLGELCKEYYLANHFDNYDHIQNAIEKTSLRYSEYANTIEIIKDKAEKWRSDNIHKLIEKANGRKIAIWGAGKGGKQLLKTLKKKKITVDCFVDAKADSIIELKKIPVKKSEILNKDNYIVFISLLTYKEDIAKILSDKNFEKNIDYLYVNFPNY